MKNAGASVPVWWLAALSFRDMNLQWRATFRWMLVLVLTTPSKLLSMVVLEYLAMVGLLALEQWCGPAMLIVVTCGRLWKDRWRF
ncbi:MAG: hypothetical protein ACKPKO_20290 [Candidatus Fonsibacter sp.]